MSLGPTRITKAMSHLRLATGLIVCLACSPEPPTIDPDTHLAEIEEWHSRRVESLKQPDSWFSVVGLYWLEAGPNSFGSDSNNTLVFPAAAPPRIGMFFRTGTSVEMVVEAGVPVTHDGDMVSSLELTSNDPRRPTVARLGSFQWFVIERADRVGIRLRDTAAPAIEAFDGIEMFPISLSWRIPARLDRYDPPKMIRIPNIIGTVSVQPSPGAVVFEVDGEELRLDVTGDPNGERFSIVFGDRTNAAETYGGGRFLTVNAPDENGHMFIDFNKATNPPCAFTAFATCPLPPRQNHLTARIEAGEKIYKHSGH
ncbi:DUF1684 domain-containing protein [Gemmatimonadota bacterium]